jgi:hypothetical protein
MKLKKARSMAGLFRFDFASALFPLAHVDEVSGDCRGP